MVSAARISIHAPLRERRRAVGEQIGGHDFNPRSLAGATEIDARGGTRYTISIHVPSRERPCANSSAGRGHKFQSTLPHGSDAAWVARLLLMAVFQSTLPRGSDYRTIKADHDRIISIHAPSRERLFITVCTVDSIIISIHAPSRERPNSDFNLPASNIFQSTLPRGSDYRTIKADHDRIISIHAPSRERQNTCVGIGQGRIHFNPRSLAGATAISRYQTHLNRYFNPRSLTGATAYNSMYKILTKISIHAPSRERRVLCP